MWAPEIVALPPAIKMAGGGIVDGDAGDICRGVRSLDNNARRAARDDGRTRHKTD